MAQAVSRRPLSAEARVRARLSPCGIWGGRSGTGPDFSLSFSVYLCQYDHTMAVRSHASPGGRTIGLLVAAAFQRQFRPIDVNSYKLD
jgi:hypothetical protein